MDRKILQTGLELRCFKRIRSCALECYIIAELCMCDEISILANLWMFVRSVTQYFVLIVAQYQYQAIVIYTRFSTKIDISLLAIYRSLRTINHIFACLWKFKNSTSYFLLACGCFIVIYTRFSTKIDISLLAISQAGM